MLIEEFIKRVNFEVTPGEYKKIEKQYMASDFEKDAFCNEWVESGGIEGVLRCRMAGEIELPKIKRYTNQELMETVVGLVKKSGEYEKAEAILDYFLSENYHIFTILNSAFDFHAVADFGGSEGIYLSCVLRGDFGVPNKDCCGMGTFKTLKDDLEAMKVMAELGGILNFFLNEFVNRNIENFVPDATRKEWAKQRAERKLRELTNKR